MSFGFDANLESMKLINYVSDTALAKFSIVIAFHSSSRLALA